MQTIKATIDQRLLGELPRFFQGITAMLRELYQNAHRAGATELNIELDDSWTLLTFTDNGIGCQDPQQMLSAGLTGWDETQVTEPAGMGFFSLLNPSLVSSVTVESQIWSMVLKPEHVLAGHPIKVSENGCCRKGMRIEIRFKLPIYTANQWDKPSEEKWLEDIKDTRGIYPSSQHEL